MSNEDLLASATVINGNSGPSTEIDRPRPTESGGNGIASSDNKSTKRKRTKPLYILPELEEDIYTTVQQNGGGPIHFFMTNVTSGSAMRMKNKRAETSENDENPANKKQ